MIEIPRIVEIGSNPLWLFSFLALLLAGLHLWLVFWKPIGEVWWKRLDYIWLAVAAIGLIGQAAQVRQLWFTSAYEIANGQVASALTNLKDRVEFASSSSICRKFNKTKFSPEDFDQVQREFDFACSEFKELSYEINKSGIDRNVGFLKLLDTKGLRSKLKSEMLIQTLDDIEKAYIFYENALEERSSAKVKSNKSIGEKILVILSPYLLILALALRITKNSGEIRLKKLQQKGQPDW